MARPDDNTPRLLTVAVTSRALFDLEESHALYESEGVEAYADYQRRLEDEILEPGVAFPVVRKLLALNRRLPPGAPQVEVILLSRNSADTGLRIFNSIQHHGLGIVRAVFTAGEPTWPYVAPFGTDLFLSANPESVRRSLQRGVAAATIRTPGICVMSLLMQSMILTGSSDSTIEPVTTSGPLKPTPKMRLISPRTSSPNSSPMILPRA